MAVGQRKNTTRYLTFGKASGDSKASEFLVQRSCAFSFTAGIEVKNIEARGQSWACNAGAAKFAVHSGSPTARFRDGGSVGWGRDGGNPNAALSVALYGKYFFFWYSE